MATLFPTGVARLLATIVVMLAALTAASAACAREFRAADNQAENYPTVQALMLMSRLVAERTGLCHTISVFHSRQLGEEEQTIEQPLAGVIDIDRINVAPITKYVPIASVLALPFLFRSVEHLHAVLDVPIGEEILDAFMVNGFVGLTFYNSGSRSIYNNVRPVRALADVKGLRIRVEPSASIADMIRALGAEPVQLPSGQLVTGLSTGLIDGAENNWPSFVTTNHFKYARHFSLTEHIMTPEVLVMSLPAWQSLSACDRRIFRDAARESNSFMRAQWMGLEEQSRRNSEAAGILIVRDFDRGPFERAMSDIYARAARDPAIAGLIERIRRVH